MIDFDGVVKITERNSLPGYSGVYYVCDQLGEILYIGRATNIRQRWYSHHKLGDALEVGGCTIAWERVDGGKLAEYEARQIQDISPKWNVVFPSGSPGGSYVPHVRVDDDVYEALQKLSEETELSIARLVNKAIREWLEKRQAQVKDE